MRAVALGLVVLLAGAGCLERGARADAASAQDLPQSFPFDGVERTYALHVPPQADNGTPLPLLLMLHPALTSAGFVQTYGLDDVADERGFFVLYADGFSPTEDGDWRTWNATYCCFPARSFAIDDVGFLSALLEHVRAQHAIDPARIGVAGHSNGAMMAFRFAAERSDLVSSVVAVGGAIGGQSDGGRPVQVPKDPDHPVSALIVNALEDPNLPYEGGRAKKGFLGRDLVHLPVSRSASFWLEADGLDDAFTTWQQDNVTYEQHGSPPGLEVLLVTTHGGHGWPGAPDLPGFLESPKVPDATRLATDFFLDHPKVDG